MVKKYMKLGCMASIVENKVIKLKYEFIIYLARLEKNEKKGSDER
jgi:hypothetical protein